MSCLGRLALSGLAMAATDAQVEQLAALRRCGDERVRERAFERQGGGVLVDVFERRVEGRQGARR